MKNIYQALRARLAAAPIRARRLWLFKAYLREQRRYNLFKKEIRNGSQQLEILKRHYPFFLVTGDNLVANISTILSAVLLRSIVGLDTFSSRGELSDSEFRQLMEFVFCPDGGGGGGGDDGGGGEGGGGCDGGGGGDGGGAGGASGDRGDDGDDGDDGDGGICFPHAILNSVLIGNLVSCVFLLVRHNVSPLQAVFYSSLLSVIFGLRGDLLLGDRGGVVLNTGDYDGVMAMRMAWSLLRCGDFVLMLFSALLLVIFGLRGYPGEGPPQDELNKRKFDQDELALSRFIAKRQRQDTKRIDVDAKIEEGKDNPMNIYDIEETKLHAEAMEECEDEEPQEEDSEVSEDYIDDDCESDEEEFDVMWEAKAKVAEKMRRACSSVVGSALALSDLSKNQKKDIARLINTLTREGPKHYEQRTLNVPIGNIDKYNKAVESELGLIGKKIKHKSLLWKGHKTINGYRRSNDNVVMVSSIPLEAFHQYTKGVCYATNCFRKITKHNQATAFLQCEHSEIFCDQCIDTEECPICHDSALKTKLKKHLCKILNNKILGLNKAKEENAPDPWQDISDVFPQRSGRFGALMYFKTSSKTTQAYDIFKSEFESVPSIRVWNYQNVSQTKQFLKRLDLAEAVKRCVYGTKWGKWCKHRKLKMVLWSDGCGPYTVTAIVLLDPTTGVFSEVQSFMWFKGGENLLKLVFRNVVDGINKIHKAIGKQCGPKEQKQTTVFTIDGIVDMGDHHLTNILAGIGAGQSSYADIRGHSLVDYTHLLPYHHWFSVWSVDEKNIIWDHLQTRGVEKRDQYEMKYDKEPIKKIEKYIAQRNARTACFAAKVPSLYSYCDRKKNSNDMTIRIISLCPRFHNNFHRNSFTLAMYLRMISPLLGLHYQTLQNAPARLNEKGDMVSSFQATYDILAYFQRELTPLMLDSGIPTIEAFAHGLTLALALSKMETRLQMKGKPVKDMKQFAIRYGVYSYCLHMLATQMSATFGHQTQGRKTAKNYQQNIYSVDNLIHMFRELVEFPNQVKVNERVFEAMLKEIRQYINESHGNIDGLTDFFNRKELRRKWGIKKSQPSGKPRFGYTFKYPHVIVKGSVMKWRYFMKEFAFGLPVCATLTRGFITELQHFAMKLGDYNDIVMDTEMMEIRYMVGEEKGQTITIDPRYESENDVHENIVKPEMIPILLFNNPSRTVDSELKQLFDCCGRKILPTRCLAMLFRAARVKKFLDPLESSILVDQCLDMLEIREKEGTFDYNFFKAMVLYYTDPADLPQNLDCTVGVDVESVMEMMGLPLSPQEKKQYHDETTKTELSLSEFFAVYEYVRSQRLLTMLDDAKPNLKKLATKEIKVLLKDYKECEKKRASFYKVRILNSIVNACHTWCKFSQIEITDFRPKIPSLLTPPSVVKQVSNFQKESYVIVASDFYNTIRWRLARVVIRKIRHTTESLVEWLVPADANDIGLFPHEEPDNFWMKPWRSISPIQTTALPRTHKCIGNFAFEENKIPGFTVRLAQRHFR